MKRWLGTVLFFLALAGAYLAMLPTTWVDALLRQYTRSSLAMTATSGTLWRGQGTLQAILPQGEAVTLAPVTWTIVLPELLRLRLHLVMRSSQTGSPLLDATLAPGEAHLHEVRLEVPAALLGVTSPTLRAAGLSGQMAVQASDVRLAQAGMGGKARITWQSAGSELTSVRPLGNYQLELEGQGGGLDLRLTTLGGLLNLNGSGRLQAGRAPDVRIMAVPAVARRQELVPMLRMLGREVSPGTYQLTLDQNVGAV